MELSTELIAAIVALLGALTALIKSRIDVKQIAADRETTAELRNKDSADLHDKVLKLEFQCGANKDSIADFNRRFDDTTGQINAMNTQLAAVLVRIDNIAELLKEIRDERQRRDNG